MMQQTQLMQRDPVYYVWRVKVNITTLICYCGCIHSQSYQLVYALQSSAVNKTYHLKVFILVCLWYQR